MPLPTVLMTDVIRSAHQGHSHGGIYLIDLERGHWERVFDYNEQQIDWEGRGQGRGLRGIAFRGEEIWIAASDELFVFDRGFRVLRSFRCPYLRHCHEICIDGDRLYATSTLYDSVLEFDLVSERFVRGYCLRRFGPEGQVRFATFDPNRPGGPERGDSVHLNMVTSREGRLYVCGVALDRVLVIEEGRVRVYARVPSWTHNCQPYGQGLIMNCTEADAIVYQRLDGSVVQRFPIVRYPESALRNADLPRDYARQGFGRGLALGDDGLIIGGSSPGTVTAYRLGQQGPIRSVNVTMDVRNTPHGLAIWPF